MSEVVVFVLKGVVVAFLVLLTAFSIIRYALEQYYSHKAKYTQQMIADASASGVSSSSFRIQQQ